jgi:hypothetical protein
VGPSYGARYTTTYLCLKGLDVEGAKMFRDDSTTEVYREPAPREQSHTQFRSLLVGLYPCPDSVRVCPGPERIHGWWQQ